jgi:hypothetical protein
MSRDIIFVLVYLCIPYDSHNKQRLSPQTALTGWALQRKRNVFPVRYEMNFVYVTLMNLRLQRNTQVLGHEDV